MSAPRVLVTRDPAAALPLAVLLRECGCEPLAARLLEAQLPADTRPLRRLLREATEPAVPTWLCVTSATTVAALAAVAESPDWGAVLDAARRGASGSAPAGGGRLGLRTASVGAATTRALGEYGVGVDFAPSSASSAAGMLAEWPEDPRAVPSAQTCRVLLPVSSLASRTLQDGLTDRGYRVERVSAYETVPAPAARPLASGPVPTDAPPEWTSEHARAACATGAVAAVVVTAPSRAAALLNGNTPAEDVAWVAIGEPTAQALRHHGVAPVTAAQPTPDALAAAVGAALRRPAGSGTSRTTRTT
ncbi:hypothetical protein EAE32_05270 [Kocuria tytonicola]|uniref:Uroporphyrinogen-III synthase n=1 Tax=Kocuria tytonicola TaxID=2055946 RepID=A0A3L9L6Y4_9MICC|nr:uroporphyrinogen-III synthase [Kocuria tytonicola]RLY94580.1 hypothetical protein EAE32_05270 [Kocuria tytonicola]